MTVSKNFLILIIILLIGGIFVLAAERFFEICPDDLLACPENSQQLPSDENPPVDGVACTMEAKECPDGSYVGRSGPNCEFAACPTVVENPDEPVSSDDMVVCTMDAKQCPDGSYVGRVGPDCSFAPCPTAQTQAIVCADSSRNVDACIEIYQPVCASVEVQCITAPCDPVPQTYSNSCFACSDDNVVSYTMGACGGDASF